MQVNDKADGILFLSLISGRNAEMQQGKQVITAPILKHFIRELSQPAIYLLIVVIQPLFHANATNPFLMKKTPVSNLPAIAGEMLGLKLIFMDGGSGAGT